MAGFNAFRMGVLYENLSSKSEFHGGRCGDSSTSLRQVNDFVPAFSMFEVDSAEIW